MKTIGSYQKWHSRIAVTDRTQLQIESLIHKLSESYLRGAIISRFGEDGLERQQDGSVFMSNDTPYLN